MPSTVKRKRGRPRGITFERFLTHLRRLKGQFEIRYFYPLADYAAAPHRRIRQAGPLGACPISAVCNLLHGTVYQSHILTPARKIGMNKKLANHIANAADTKQLPPTERNYRNRMLRALGLREAV